MLGCTRTRRGKRAWHCSDAAAAGGVCFGKNKHPHRKFPSPSPPENQDVLCWLGAASPSALSAVDGVMKTNSIHKSLQQEEFQVVDKSAKCLQKDDVVFACLHNLWAIMNKSEQREIGRDCNKQHIKLIWNIERLRLQKKNAIENFARRVTDM